MLNIKHLNYSYDKILKVVKNDTKYRRNTRGHGRQ